MPQKKCRQKKCRLKLITANLAITPTPSSPPATRPLPPHISPTLAATAGTQPPSPRCFLAHELCRRGLGVARTRSASPLTTTADEHLVYIRNGGNQGSR